MRYIVFIAAILIATPATAQAGTSICFHMFGSEPRSAMPPYVMNALAAINDRPALDPSDRRLFSEALNRAMVRETGSVSEWGDPAGQNHGQVLAERTTSDKTHYADPSIIRCSLASKCGPTAASLAGRRMVLGTKSGGGRMAQPMSS